MSKINSRIKRGLLIFAGVLLLLFITFYIYLYIGFSQSKKGVEQAMKRFTPGTVEYETYKRWNKQFDEYFGHLNRAEGHLKNKEYDLAIKEYDSLIAKNHNDYVAHRGLLDVYESSDQYENALRQIKILRRLRPNLKHVQDEMNTKEKSIKEKMAQP